MNVIGIRAEDKSTWEARAPLIPTAVGELVAEGVHIQVQRCPHRAFTEDAYRAAGASIVDELSDPTVIVGVKEIPPHAFLPGRAYVFFSHTIKGQPENMPALSRLLELGCTLIDYERITDEQGRRIVFFGRYAGLAGMIDTLWTLGRRLEAEGHVTPFSTIKPAHRYGDLAEAQSAIRDAGQALAHDGLPESLCPCIFGVTGYGQVSCGAQEVLDWLPIEPVAPSELAEVPARRDVLYKTVFEERHLVEPVDPAGRFVLQDYYDHPVGYRSLFAEHAVHLSVLVNCIYWEPKYPRLLTRDDFLELTATSAPLRVVGDITCDIDGSIACTTRATTPDDPVYVYDPVTGATTRGVVGPGPVVLAVDFLPCELPVDASRFFSTQLAPFVAALAAARLDGPLEDSGLPNELRRALIAYRGELTPAYAYLRAHLDA